MALVNYKELLAYAKEHKITIGAFNSLNMEMIQAVSQAAENKNAPLIIQTYRTHVDYAGADYMQAIVNVAARNVNVKLALGLDHGSSYEQAKLCIDNNYSGVMIDLASEDYEINVRETKRVVALAHEKGISVEAELGTISNADCTPEEIASGYTDPIIARKFVEDTKIDCLAVSIGTAHGCYKYEPKINFELLQELLDTVACPIVVHGGSGTPDSEVEKMVRMGIAKLNIGTDFFNAYNQAIYEVYQENGGAQCDIAEVMNAARNAVKTVAEHKLDVLTRFRV